MSLNLDELQLGDHYISSSFFLQCKGNSERSTQINLNRGFYNKIEDCPKLILSIGKLNRYAILQSPLYK